MPVLKLQQLIDQGVLHRAVEIAVFPGRAETIGLRQHRAERIRVVAPALAQHVSNQRVADDALGERVAVGRFLPLRGKIPVIGNIVVVEDHQARQMREGPCDTAQASLEGIDARLLQRITLAPFGNQLRRFWRDQRPGCRRPHQQVHGHDFGEGHQMIVGTAAGENRLARPAEKSLAQGFIALQRR